jgi:hypothetical protein
MAETFPLKQGSRGKLVEAAQKWLNLALECAGRADRLAPDGVYGARTAAVVSSLFFRDRITEADYRLMIQSVDNMKARARELRDGAPNAQGLLNRLVATDQQNFSNLLRILHAYDKATPAERQRDAALYASAWRLAARLRARVQTLQANQGQVVFRYGAATPEDRELAARYAPGFDRAAIGIAPVVIGAVILVALIVGAGATVAIYNWLEPAYRDATTDFQETGRLREILSRLPEADRAEVLAEAEMQVDRAYAKGKRDGKFSGMGSTVQILLIGAGCLAAYGVLAPSLRGLGNGRNRHGR